MKTSPFVIVSTEGMHETAASVLKILAKKYRIQLPHYRVEYEPFANGEVLPHVPVTVRRQHVFLFHPMQLPSPNDAIVKLLLVNDMLMRASVAGITLVLPYIPYLRQDRKHKPRVPISARMLADIIESNRAVERIITVDMHADQEQGFFSIPVDNVQGMHVFVEQFLIQFKKTRENFVVVAPDFGGAVRARRFAKKLGDAPVAIFEKRRPRVNASEVVSIVGEPIEGKTVIICDDMIDTGGTIRGVVSVLKERGAREVFVCATHGIFSGDSLEHFARAQGPVMCSTSIPRSADFVKHTKSWLSMVPIDSLLADAVFQATRVGGSVSHLTH